MPISQLLPRSRSHGCPPSAVGPRPGDGEREHRHARTSASARRAIIVGVAGGPGPMAAAGIGRTGRDSRGPPGPPRDHLDDNAGRRPHGGRRSCRVTRAAAGSCFTAWRQALGLQDVQETTMGDGTSYVRVHASRGTIRVTLTAVVANMDATVNPGRRSPRPVQGADANGPAVDVAPAPPWARPAPPPDLAGPSSA
jgi:hypothetical protein